MKTTAKDLRIHTKQILDAVDRGEEVVITVRGEPRAKIVSTRAAHRRSKSRKPAPLFGIWKNYRKVKNVTTYIDNLRRTRD